MSRSGFVVNMTQAFGGQLEFNCRSNARIKEWIDVETGIADRKRVPATPVESPVAIKSGTGSEVRSGMDTRTCAQKHKGYQRQQAILEVRSHKHLML